MVRVFISLVVGLFVISPLALAGHTGPQFKPGEVRKQAVRSKNTPHRKLETQWGIIEKGLPVQGNEDLMNSLDKEYLKGIGVELSNIRTLKALDFYLLHNKHYYVRLSKDETKAFMPFEMSLQIFAIGEKVTQGTVDLRGEMVMSIGESGNVIEDIEVKVFTYSDLMENLFFQSYPHSLYGAEFIQSVVSSVLTAAFKRNNEMESLIELANPLVETSDIPSNDYSLR